MQGSGFRQRTQGTEHKATSQPPDKSRAVRVCVQGPAWQAQGVGLGLGFRA